MYHPSKAGRRLRAPVCERLENRQLFALAEVHAELHRPPNLVSIDNDKIPDLIMPTVGMQLSLAGLLNGPVFGFDTYTGDGKGNFKASGQYDANDNAPGIDIDSTIAVGDFNGDGFPDVALKLFSITGQPTPVGETIGERIVPFYNTGKGGFAKGVQIPVGESFTVTNPQDYDLYTSHSGLAIGDVDGDGVGDIVSWTGNSATTLLMNTGSTSIPKLKFKQEFGPQQVSKKSALIGGLGDVDGDGRADLIGFGNASNSVIVRGWDPKTKQFIAGSAVSGPKDLAGPVTGIRIADFNGDGRPDLLLFSDNRYSVGVNVTKADPNTGIAPVFGFSWGTTQTLNPQLTSNDVGVGDVNGDGLADLFTIQDRPRAILSIIK